MATLMYPQRIIFGNGVLDKIAEEVFSFGRKALLVTGKTSMRKTGVLDRVLKILSSGGIKVELFDKVEHDPSLDTVNEGIEVARERGVSSVIGLGGGSPIDAAKAIAIVAPREGKVERYYYGEESIDTPGIPFIAVPTTAGTGAEITSNAVLTDKKNKVKKSLRSPFMIAKVALVDPQLTLFCPPSLTAYSGMDALTQAIECFISKASNPITDVLALEAIGLLFFNLPLAVKNGKDMQAREKVCLGSLLQAMAFSNAGLGAVHGLSHPLGAYYNIPHGLACAVLLPYVLEVNLPFCREKMDIVAKKIGVEKGENVPSAIRELLQKIDIPPTLKQWKIKKEDIPSLVAKSKSRSMSMNPGNLSDRELSQILEKVI